MSSAHGLIDTHAPGHTHAHATAHVPLYASSPSVQQPPVHENSGLNFGFGSWLPIGNKAGAAIGEKRDRERAGAGGAGDRAFLGTAPIPADLAYERRHSDPQYMSSPSEPVPTPASKNSLLRQTSDSTFFTSSRKINNNNNNSNNNNDNNNNDNNNNDDDDDDNNDASNTSNFSQGSDQDLSAWAGGRGRLRSSSTVSQVSQPAYRLAHAYLHTH